MTATATATCNARSRTQQGRVFICLAPPHPEHPSRHYFQLDSEESYVLDDRPSNAHLESSIEAFFRDEVRKAGGIALKLVPTSKGIPDRLVILPGGHIYFVELKQARGKTSPAQDVWHERLRDRGARVYVLSGRGQVVSWLRQMAEENGPQFRKRKSAE